MIAEFLRATLVVQDIVCLGVVGLGDSLSDNYFQACDFLLDRLFEFLFGLLRSFYTGPDFLGCGKSLAGMLCLLMVFGHALESEREFYTVEIRGADFPEGSFGLELAIFRDELLVSGVLDLLDDRFCFPLGARHAVVDTSNGDDQRRDGTADEEALAGCWCNDLFEVEEEVIGGLIALVELFLEELVDDGRGFGGDLRIDL